jgi:hypothetical protein
MDNIRKSSKNIRIRRVTISSTKLIRSNPMTKTVAEIQNDLLKTSRSSKNYSINNTSGDPPNLKDYRPIPDIIKDIDSEDDSVILKLNELLTPKPLKLQKTITGRVKPIKSMIKLKLENFKHNTSKQRRPSIENEK